VRRTRGTPCRCAGPKALACGLLLLLLGLGCGAPRVLVVGLDGATWAVMDPLIDAGHLPNIGSLVRAGATFDLDCVPAAPTIPCLCPPVWTSVVTGHPVGKHRITGFNTPSSVRRVKALWSVLAEHGGKSRLLAYRGTWPPEHSGGVVLTEPGAIAAGRELFDSIGTASHPGFAEPDTLARPTDLLEQLGVLPASTPPSDRLPAWEPFAMDRVSMDTLLRLELRERDQPREGAGAELTVILLHSPDKSEHLSWNAIQDVMGAPIHVPVLLALAAAWDGPVWNDEPVPWSNVPDQYLEIDEWLGQLLSATTYDYVVFVSDHGMRAARRGASPECTTQITQRHTSGSSRLRGRGSLRRRAGWRPFSTSRRRSPTC
jgi:hypothetical protein